MIRRNLCLVPSWKELWPAAWTSFRLQFSKERGTSFKCGSFLLYPFHKSRDITLNHRPGKEAFRKERR